MRRQQGKEYVQVGFSTSYWWTKHIRTMLATQALPGSISSKSRASWLLGDKVYLQSTEEEDTHDSNLLASLHLQCPDDRHG